MSQLMDVIVQVGNALGYAHSVGVLRQDIKLENIVIGPCGEVLLLDWGLTKLWRAASPINDDETEITPVCVEPSMTGEANL